MTHHRTYRVIATATERYFVDVAARDETIALIRAEKLWHGGMRASFQRLLEVPEVSFETDAESNARLADIASEDRARWAKHALLTFSRETGSSMGEEALHDLLCDLAHYARSVGLDARDALDRAADVATSEFAEEVQS
jgi:DICT domain-containing protein